MKFNNDNNSIKKIEGVLSEYNNIKNSSTAGSLQDFVDTINRFNSMCTDKVSFVADAKTGTVYVEIRKIPSFPPNFKIRYDKIISYGLQDNKLIIYTFWDTISKSEYDTEGNVKYLP